MAKDGKIRVQKHRAKLREEGCSRLEVWIGLGPIEALREVLSGRIFRYGKLSKRLCKITFPVTLRLKNNQNKSREKVNICQHSKEDTSPSMFPATSVPSPSAFLENT